MNWTGLDTWIVVAAGLSAVSCALLGNFLVLRRMSMMGDAISHTVLPGLAIAFLLTHSLDSVAMFIGAAVVGVLTAVFVQWVHVLGRVEQSAAMGVVFTTLFAIGLIIIRQAADEVHIDADCVLYGAVELVPLDVRTVLGMEVPRAVVPLAAVGVVNVAFVAGLWKELKLSTFDPALATTLGINATLMHYLLMALVAVTTVASFEVVGSILVIAMLIVPPAAAYLLTDRLGVMVLLSVVIAAASAGLGHVGAITAPGWFGFVEPGSGASMSTNTAGMMATVAGLLFTAALIGSPRHGLVSKAVHRGQLALQIAREDVLGLLYRLEEAGLRDAEASRRAAALIRELPSVGPVARSIATRQLQRWGLMERAAFEAGDSADVSGDGAAGEAGASDGKRWNVVGWRLTDEGRREASQLIRSHRLWETYLMRHMDVPADHVHSTAERLEHLTDAAVRRALAAGTDTPETDPHGKEIPREGEG